MPAMTTYHGHTVSKSWADMVDALLKCVRRWRGIDGCWRYAKHECDTYGHGHNHDNSCVCSQCQAWRNYEIKRDLYRLDHGLPI